MKLIAIISISMMLSVLLSGSLAYGETEQSYLYAGLPSGPLDNEDTGDDVEDDSAPRQSDSGGSSDRDKTPRSSSESDQTPSGEGFERYEDWYKPDPAYQ